MMARKAKIPAAMTPPELSPMKQRASLPYIGLRLLPSGILDQGLIQVLLIKPHLHFNGSRVHGDLPGSKMVEKHQDPQGKPH